MISIFIVNEFINVNTSFKTIRTKVIRNNKLECIKIYMIGQSAAKTLSFISMGKVQRLSERSSAKRNEAHDTRKCEDIVWSAWGHAAARNGAGTA